MICYIFLIFSADLNPLMIVRSMHNTLCYISRNTHLNAFLSERLASELNAFNEKNVKAFIDAKISEINALL